MLSEHSLVSFRLCHLWPGNSSLAAVSATSHVPLLNLSKVIILILSLLFKTRDLLCGLLLLCLCIHCSLFYTAHLLPNFSPLIPSYPLYIL